MTHIGFADVIKYILPIKLLVGKLDADVLHENLCKCHLEFFDTYLKKLKDTPELKSNDDVKVSVYEADMSEEKEPGSLRKLKKEYMDCFFQILMYNENI